MFHNINTQINLKEGAVFIADAHENGVNRKDFALFLKKMELGEIKTPQLFLMGDIFDFLSKGAKYTLLLYKHELEMLDKIAKNTEVYYLEGNHDFNLSGIFKYVNVISIKNQPLYAKTSIIYAISHGDLYVGFFYNIYTKIIRSKSVVFLLDKLGICEFITKIVLKSQISKKICREIEDFENKIIPKLKKYKNCDMILEGHYHQNKTISYKQIKYINFASFACDKLFYRFEKSQFNAFLFQS
ncbi:MAG: metallophosphoesterase [Campylobacteraceae bacterium]|jgi:UDP-2,3-diacylglucosamine hydrolase|nr:metallophosphoesterase [Campylobacteraceae bacterium]